MRHLGAAGAIIHDEDSVASVGQHTLHFELGDHDRELLIKGMRDTARVWFAAGAHTCIPSIVGGGLIRSVDEIDEAEQTTAKRFGGFAAAAVAEFEYEPTEVGVDDLDVPEEEGSLVAKRYGGFAAAAVADLE